MAAEAQVKQVAIEQLPFEIEKREDHIEVYSKPKGHLSKDKRRAFEANKITVRIFLFDKDDVERLNKIQANIIIEEAGSFHKMYQRIKHKISGKNK